MSKRDYPGGWFGASWGAPVCDLNTRKFTPIGQPCAECAVPITGSDQGMLVPFASEPVRLEAYHLWCFLKITVGEKLADSSMRAMGLA